MASMWVTGSAGVDRVFIEAGTVVDATRLGGSMDKVYFTGRWSDYTKVVEGSTLRLTRRVNGFLEEVLVSAGAGVLNDLLVFADGNVSSERAATQLRLNAGVALAAAGGLTGASAEKSSLPQLASARVLGLSQDTGVAGDGLTRSAEQSVLGSFSGAWHVGDVLQVQVGGVWRDAQITSNTGAGGTFRLDGVQLQPGAQTLAVRVQDLSGRTLQGTGRTVVLDTQAPTATLRVAAPEDAWVNARESGVSLLLDTTDLQRGDTVQLCWAQGARAGQALGSAVVVQAAHLAAGALRLWVPKAVLAEGDNLLSARLRDVVGNEGSTQSLTVTRDTQVARPLLSVVAGQDARLGSAESSVDLRVAGGSGAAALREGDAVQLWRGATPLGEAHLVSAQEALDNALVLNATRGLLGLNGTYAVAVRVGDAAGNAALSAPLTLTVDARSLAGLLEVSPVAGDTGLALPLALTDRVMKVDESWVWLRVSGVPGVSSGRLRAGDVVTLMQQVGADMVALTGASGQPYHSTVAQDGGVAYLKVLKSDLTSGTHVFQVQVQDQSGNVGVSNRLGVEADTTAPTLSAAAPPQWAAVGSPAVLREGDRVVLTLTFTEPVWGLSSGQDSSVLAVAGSGVAASWAGSAGSQVRTLTLTVPAGVSGAVTVDEAALQAALALGVQDLSGNAFAYTAHGGQVPAIDGGAQTVPRVNARPSGKVVVTGDATQGQTLSADVSALGDAEGLGSLSCQWLANGREIVGATGSSLVLAAAQVGQALSVRVSYRDGSGWNESITSAATAAVAGIDNHHPTGEVTLSGTAQVEQTLTASAAGLADADGFRSPPGFSYQWLADGQAITGATGSSFTLTQAQQGRVMSVQLRYTDRQGTAELVSSAATDPVASVSHTGVVSVSGTPAQGQVLTASLSDRDEVGGEPQWQWFVQTADVQQDIDGATANTFTPTQAQVGQTLGVRVRYTDSLSAEGTEESAALTLSTAVTNRNDNPSGAVTVAGDATVGSALTADTAGLADADGLASPDGFSYQWLADDVAIVGATQARYTLSAAELGKAMKVQVRYTDLGGTTEQVSSEATVHVASASNHRPTGAVTVTGTAAKRSVLSASASGEGGLQDADTLGSFSYQWYAGDVAIAGATASSLTLAQAQVGQAVKVKVSYTDGGGTEEAVFSAPTEAVLNANAAPTGEVTLTGTATQYKTLQADASGLSDADGLGSWRYQWYANDGSGDVAIAGAKASSFTLTQAQVGKTVRVKVSYTDGGGTTETVYSAPSAAVANVNDTPAGAVSISGTATQGQTLTAHVGLKDLDGLGDLQFQWLANGEVIDGATGSSITLTQAQVGKTLSVQVSYTDGQGSAQSVTGTALYSLSLGPGNGQLIAPVRADGQTFYYWDKNGDGVANDVMSLAGLASVFKYDSTYRFTASGISGTYRYGTLGGVRVALPTSLVDFGLNSGTAVAGDAANSTYDGLPAIWDAMNGAGTGTGLSGVPAQWAVSDTNGSNPYYWSADPALSGSHIVFSLGSGNRSSNTDTTLRQVALQLVPAVGADAVPSLKVANVNDAGTVGIVGTVAQGQTLTAVAADLDGLSGSVGYQWALAGVDVPGATSNKLALTQAEVGKGVSVRVNFQDDTGVSEAASASTDVVANVNDAPVGSVTVTGTAAQYQTLSGSASLSDADGLGSFSYQWKANGANISGATGTTYKLTQAEVGKKVTLVVSYTDGFGFKESVSSSETAAVANVNDTVTGSVSLSGTFKVGSSVTADTSKLADLDGLGTFSYQWMAGGSAIVGAANAATYTPQSADAGKALSVKVSYTDAQGGNESVTSVSPPASISLGANGKLMAPVLVDGSHIYYVWDKNGDGSITALDRVNFSTLSALAADNNFVATPSGTVDAAHANFLINGVRLVLPVTLSAGTVNGYQTGTAVTGLADNPSFNGLQAIWDAFNGVEAVTSNGTTNYAGVPSAWAAGYYWGSELSSTSHGIFGLQNGYRTTNPDANVNYVAFELAPSATGYVAPSTMVVL